MPRAPRRMRPGDASATGGRWRYSFGAVAIRTVVAEDSLLVREGIVRLLSSAPDIDVVASCADYDEVVAAVDEQEPDVVVTDIKMPPTSTDEGIRLATRLRATHPEVGVVVLSRSLIPATCWRCSRPGTPARLPPEGAAQRQVGPRVGDPLGGRGRLVR